MRRVLLMLLCSLTATAATPAAKSPAELAEGKAKVLEAKHAAPDDIAFAYAACRDLAVKENKAALALRCQYQSETWHNATRP